MNPNLPHRALAIITLSVASLLSTAAQGAVVGAVDRDVVRDPYSSWVGNLGQTFAGSSNIVLAQPNVGGTLSAGTIPTFASGGFPVAVFPPGGGAGAPAFIPTVTGT